MAVNGIVRRGMGVRLTTKDLSFAHPVYLSFAVWGAICLLLGAFAVGQSVLSFSVSPSSIRFLVLDASISYLAL
jgi:hypothetical protein